MLVGTTWEYSKLGLHTFLIQRCFQNFQIKGSAQHLITLVLTATDRDEEQEEAITNWEPYSLAGPISPIQFLAKVSCWSKLQTTWISENFCANSLRQSSIIYSCAPQTVCHKLREFWLLPILEFACNLPIITLDWSWNEETLPTQNMPEDDCRLFYRLEVQVQYLLNTSIYHMDNTCWILLLHDIL